MALKNQITQSPCAGDPDFRPDFLAAWQDCPAKVTKFLSATAENSQYLRGLMEKEADWLAGALERDPDAVMDQALADVDSSSEAALATTLRSAKRRVALLVALCDLGGVWSLQQVEDSQQIVGSHVSVDQDRPGVGQELGRFGVGVQRLFTVAAHEANTAVFFNRLRRGFAHIMENSAEP